MPDRIEHEEGSDGGAFVLVRGGERIGEMAYKLRRGIAVIEHTEVSPELRGQHLGRALLDAAVAWARATGTRVRATCPYAREQFDNDPSIRDVLEEGVP